ncbi:sensor histidine kinase [Planobispora longispora]|nr:HAMP domain-containing sensor histidine kinase [Planobispora longispora]
MLNSGDRLDQTASYLPDPANTTQAILGLLSERLRGGSDSDGARTESTLVAGLRSVPGVLQAELRPADSTPPSGGELLWPAGPGRLLAVTLRDGYNSHGVPEALACLAATLDVTWRRDAEAHTGPLSRDTALATAKTEFIATVIHDLATPITPILAYAGLLADPDTGPLTTDQREFVKVIERNAMRLSELLNDLPLLVDPSSPELELRRERVDPMELVRDIVGQFRPGAVHAGITMRFHARPGPALACNSIRIRRMLDILLTTAITRSAPGDTVDVEARPTVDGWQIEIACLASEGAGEGAGAPAGQDGAPAAQGGEAADRGGEPPPPLTAGRREPVTREDSWPRIGMARAIAGMHDGTLHITDEGTGGSVIRVELPWEPARDRGEDG